jgi:hypothetical protein
VLLKRKERYRNNRQGARRFGIAINPVRPALPGANG